MGVDKRAFVDWNQVVKTAEKVPRQVVETKIANAASWLPQGVARGVSYCMTSLLPSGRRKAQELRKKAEVDRDSFIHLYTGGVKGKQEVKTIATPNDGSH